MKKRAVLFGASGAIGSHLFSYLSCEGYEVIPVVHTEVGKDKFLATLGHDFPRDWVQTSDVTDTNGLLRLSAGLGRVSIVVYAVGHCPPQGMKDIMSNPSPKSFRKEAERWMDLLVEGFGNVRTAFFPTCRTFVVIGSAITRLLASNMADERPPFWKNVREYAEAEATLDDTVGVCRNFSTVHLLKLGAVLDTPFHQGPNGEAPSYPGVTREQVAEAVAEVLKSPVSLTQFVTPETAGVHV